MICDWITAEVIRSLVWDVLEHPHQRKWSLQGFGMLRTYIGSDESVRLNIWHSEAQVPRAALIHNHPWDLDSLILAGEIRNLRYREETRGAPFSCVEIQPGPRGGPTGEPTPIHLVMLQPELYTRGMSYHQDAEEIHQTVYEDGTVTINFRQRHHKPDRALSIWEGEGEWGSAEPRRAKTIEVDLFTRSARELWKRESN